MFYHIQAWNNQYFDESSNQRQLSNALQIAYINNENMMNIVCFNPKAKEYYSMKLDLLTKATVVDDAIRFVSQKFIEKTGMR